MRAIYIIAGLLIVLSATPPEAHAQSMGNCSDIEFSRELLERFPGAESACLGVVEKDGRKYAKFNAELLSNSTRTVRIRFNKPDGTTTKPYAFAPGSDARVRINNVNYRYRELSPGQDLNIYLPPDRFEIITHDDEMTDFVATTATVSSVALVDDPEPQQRVAMLPKTAGQLPLLGLVAALMIAFGALARIARQRWYDGR